MPRFAILRRVESNETTKVVHLIAKTILNEI